MESLQGNFLISTAQMPDPRFRESLVYLCAHNDEGAMGVVVNKPLVGISIADILQSAAMELCIDSPLPVYLGGPVDMETAFFLYSSEYRLEHQMEISRTISLSSDPQILRDIARDRGPLHFVFVLGYAGWGPGQLENELSMEGWLTLPAEDEVIFRVPDDLKWKRAAEIYGIDITTYEDIIGSA